MKPLVTFDIEIYRNYFLLMFRGASSGRTVAFELFDGVSLNIDEIKKILARSTIISFNGINFDIPLLSLALTGAKPDRIKLASDAIIVTGLKPWHIEKQFNFKLLTGLDHIDLIEVAPGTASLKAYGGRIHCTKLQDLPIEPGANIRPDQREELKRYCANDLVTTQALYDKLLPQIQLRAEMSTQYGQDLRSKSDAQIAEAVIKAQVQQITGYPPTRPVVEGGTAYRYTAPAFITFEGEQLREVLAKIQQDDFIVVDSGKVTEPAWLRNLKVPIGASTYRMGIGGLHSTESSVSHHASDDVVLVDRDVASYYPTIILGDSLAPVHLGAPFLQVYRRIVERRLAAKHAGNKVEADALKITINGSFGKFGSKWSALYSPDLLIQTTVTGQLALLMLIERLELAGIPVVSANTDGVVIKCPVDKVPDMDAIVAGWELVSWFDTEASYYSALYSRDVNNYIAIKADKGGYKTKGAYASAGLAKNPANEICNAAVIKWLIDEVPVEETIGTCLDLTKFVTIRRVTGGALDQHGDYLGKVVRWYYSTLMSGPLTCKLNGYTVPRSEGAQACMDLPGEFPPDVDLDWYIAEARSILKEIGAEHATA